MLGVALAVAGLSAASTSLFPAASAGLGVEGSTALVVHAERIIVRPGVELQKHDILIEEGLITAVGEGLAVPEGAREIAALVVCAGFFDAWSTLGLDAGSATDESATASTRAADALDRYTAPHHLADALRAGVTSVRVQTGRGAAIGGIGAVVRVDPSIEGSQAIVIEDGSESASVGLPRGGRQRDIFDRVEDAERLAGEIERGRKYGESWVEYHHELEEWQKAIAEKEKELEKDFKTAKKDREKAEKAAEESGKEFKEKKYTEDKKPRKPKSDVDAATLSRVAEGEIPLVVEAHRFEEIRALLQETAKFDRLRLVIAGATEAAELAGELAERAIPVLVWPKPMGVRSDEWDEHDLALAGKLAEDDVTVLIGSGGSDTSRELRLLAALAVSHGLDRDAALNAITLAPAEAFDVADRIGSVERGKDADLLILDGDPLDTTARIQFVISQGRVVVEP